MNKRRQRTARFAPGCHQKARRFCSRHLPGKQVVPVDAMVSKIKAARDARKDLAVAS